MPDYQKINAETWDVWAKNGCEWTLPITHEEYQQTTADNYIVYLTPCIPVPHSWFGNLSGKKLLGLASGGGQQMPVFAKLGAECTVFDQSIAQLDAERMVAAREGYDITVIQGDMTKPLPFPDDSFDLIFHPVSNCYVEEVRPIWRECHRILKKDGLLLAGFDNGLNFLFEDDDPLRVVNPLPFNPLKMPKERFDQMAGNYEAIQFSHSMEEQLGGQLEAGLTLLALYEDRDRPGGPAISGYAPQYMATLAKK
ncbi:MAG: class I SAM-dependent methyltransferase [Clostridiales bacterium]|nr:class I SAM-dependent methyltransferase [Clostridiales bacterium]